VIANEFILQDALAQAEAAFTQTAFQALGSEHAFERVNLWRELACTYDKTLAWWPHQEPSFQRLLTLRDRARQLGTKKA
jgi:hypothetical protein